MQLQHQVVGDRAYPQYDHPNEVKGMDVFGINGTCAIRTGGKEEFAVGSLNEELDREAAGHLRIGTGLRKHPGLRDLALSLRPDDLIDLRRDNVTRIRAERELRIVARLDQAQFVLRIESDHLVLLLDETHRRRHRKRRHK